MIVSLLTLGLLLIPSSNAFFRLPCAKPVLNARVDPIVSFNKPSSHLHTIMGSSAIGLSTTFDDLRKSNCTTCKVNDDKSAYWIADLLYQYPNGSFEPVDHGGMLVYYLQRGAADETVEAFPDGLRMVTGDANVRNYTGTPESQAISWLCLNYNGPAEPQTHGFGNMNCRDGLRAQSVMRSCWDGVNLDSPDHKSHMAYPDGIDNGKCPDTHKHHLVTIFYEVWYNVNRFNQLNDGGRFVLSTGDATGYGHHADFMNGWDKDVLSRAVQTCTNNSGVIEDCPVFTNENRFVPDDVMNSCAAHNPLPEEKVTGLLPYLPGCIAITKGPAPATPADLDPACVAAAATQVSGKSSSSMPASSSPAKPPPSTKATSGHASSTILTSPSGTLPKTMVSSPTAPAKPPSGNNGALLSSSSSPASGGPATKLGSTSLVPSKYPAHPHSSSNPAPTGHSHHEPNHGHHSQQHGQQDDSEDTEYCHKSPSPVASKKAKYTGVPTRRRHHARQAGHGSFMGL